MQEGSMSLSVNDMMDFLDFAGGKGLINKSTAATRKKASSIILAILDETEASDLSKIDLEDVIKRHNTLAAGKIIPTTLKTYQSRTRIALGDFLDYSKNPSTWRPATKKVVSKAPKKASAAKKPITKISVDKPKELEKLHFQPSVHIDLQIHISPESTPEQIDKIFDSMRRHLYGPGK